MKVKQKMKDFFDPRKITQIKPDEKKSLKEDSSSKGEELTQEKEMSPMKYYLMLSSLILLFAVAIGLFSYMLYLIYEVRRNRTVIYTCITDENEQLPEVVTYTKKFDYIVYTDNKYDNPIWKTRKIPEFLKDFSKKKIEYYIKFKAKEFFPDYEVSIWIDRKVKIVGNLTEYLVKYLNPIDAVYMTQHPFWKDVYKEGLKMIKSGKFNDTDGLLDKTLKRYTMEKFPHMTGVAESKIMIRFHNYANSTKLMDMWWDEMKEGPNCDFLLFSYVLWKSGLEIKYMPSMFYHKEYLDAGDTFNFYDF